MVAAGVGVAQFREVQGDLEEAFKSAAAAGEPGATEDAIGAGVGGTP
jgi:hypothetical protein